MQRFARLFLELDAQTGTAEKVAALARYFQEAPAADCAWAAAMLSGYRPRQVVPTAVLRLAALQRAGLDEWLFEASYQAVGDLAETIALVLPAPRATSGLGLAAWIEERLLAWRGLSPDEQVQRLHSAWDELDTPGRFLLTKLIGGGFRVGVSRLLVQRAIAQAAGLDARQVAQRMMGFADARRAPTAQAWQRLVDPADTARLDAGQPYPFFLAHALQVEPTSLGPVAEWLAEWKYDGIRAQAVCREGSVWLWSRGEELITDRFPEVVDALRRLPPGTVLDGEILAWAEGAPAPLPFQALQTRLQRKTVTARLRREVPARFVAYDLLESEGLDRRGEPQLQRRQRLEAMHASDDSLAAAMWSVSPRVDANDWDELASRRAESRQRGVEGLMLKHREARYGTGRTKSDGVWWKWKIDPLSVDAVLLYAQAGHGRRASVYTDYTFAVWSRPPADAAEAEAVVQAIERREPPQPGALQLVPFAKAYSGLTDAEFEQVSRIVRATTLEKFGPVRSVRPTQVFELGFEGLQESRRHRSGIAVRFPRMLRWRQDKPLWEADTLDVLQRLLCANPAARPDDDPGDLDTPPDAPS